MTKPYFETKNGVLYHGDCLTIMPELDPVDLVLTDPPYNASESKLVGFKDKKYKTVNEEWDKNFQIVFLSKLPLAATASILCFCSYHLLSEYLKDSKFKLQQILHWNKTNPFPAIAKVYTPSIEYILWFINGSPYCFNKKYAGIDIIQSSICAGKERTSHPTQKPLSVINRLLLTHSIKNHIILDPFFGSGTTAVACEELNRKWIGIEISEEYCEIAAKRIERETAQLKLFK